MFTNSCGRPRRRINKEDAFFHRLRMMLSPGALQAIEALIARYIRESQVDGASIAQVQNLTIELLRLLEGSGSLPELLVGQEQKEIEAWLRLPLRQAARSKTKQTRRKKPAAKKRAAIEQTFRALKKVKEQFARRVRNAKLLS